MNKQQLAARIWESANNMRSKIEANEYKDYILGFIFYKFLSDKEENDLKKEGWTEDQMMNYLIESNDSIVKYCQDRYGYFIEYKNLFSTWLKMGSDFDVSNVRDALSAFNRLINENHKKVFEKIFETLDTGLSKLGDNSGTQTKAISKLIALIDPIPMDDKQGYDVLGFIYEYLISMFAANAGKKAGEFYTPHEVSLVMSQIVAEHLKDREKIEIYDPTSGSGSLLINIGQSVAKFLKDKDKIKYYAQELKENTYSLTRMNLVMRGIKPENIVARNGDTLADDWPYFEENDKENTYEALFVDAVVSNPPYSQKWEPKEDARFNNYGIAPKGKADYAFLLHDLYHLKSDGIMTIVLPHGVLFRGGEEEKIRTNLIENDNIDAIIGLPANIFFGTGIPTIIMVLKKKRDRSDVLIIDASKGFEKVGKNNKLRSSDIKKIVDTIIERKSIEKYSKVVEKEEIRRNGYNLNIPRYVDSSEKPESWDIYASMFGGIPNAEIEEFKEYWNAFPNLRNMLFSNLNYGYSEIKVENIRDLILNCDDLKKYQAEFNDSFKELDSYLQDKLINHMNDIIPSKEEGNIATYIFDRVEQNKLLDKYTAYQYLDNEWQRISIDLEIIKTEGFSATKKVDPNMVTKKKDGKDIEIQEGWVGHVIPFDLIQEVKLKSQKDSIKMIEEKLSSISNDCSEILESIDEEDKESNNELFSEEKDAFVASEITKYVNKQLKGQKIIDEESFDYKIKRVNELLLEEKNLKKHLKDETSQILVESKKAIENLSDSEVMNLLKKKWIDPIVDSLYKLPTILINDFVAKLQKLIEKYQITLVDIDNDIETSSKELCKLIDELEADEFDKKGLQELKKLLGGNENDKK